MLQRRLVLIGLMVTLGVGATGCMGPSDISDVLGSTDVAADTGTNGVSTLLDSILSQATSQPSSTRPSKREIVMRVLDLLVTASDPSDTEQMIWDVASGALSNGKKGLRDSLTTLLFSPLADGFISQLSSGSGN